MTAPIYLRDVARALEAHLNSPAIAEQHGTNVHWITVEGESSLLVVPTKHRSPAYFDEVEMVAILSQGHSEGSLITIAGRPDRYKRGEIEPLLLIKTLNGLMGAGVEAALAVRWFEQGMPGLAEEQAARGREATRTETGAAHA